MLVNCSSVNRGRAIQHEGSGLKEEHDGVKGSVRLFLQKRRGALQPR